MEVKAGFKQTEVGVIPEEWQALPLAQVGGFRKGQGIRKNEAASGNIPCVRYGEIYTHHNDIIRAYNSYISLTVAETSRRLRKGDILFAGSGETKAEIGKAVAFVEDIEAYAGGDIVILSPQAACSEYLGYVLNSPVVTRQKASKGQGDAVVHISADALGTVYAPLPPLIEQRAIAAALSDVDALLGGLDRLIAKKRDLKQSAMQQLLTGQIRLPGFSGEWNTTSLSAVTTRLSGYWGADKADRSHTKRVSVVRAGDISVDGKLEGTATRYFTNNEFEKSEIKNGDVVLTGSGSVGKVWWCADANDLAASNFVRILRPDQTRIDGQFLYQLLLSDSVQQIVKSHIAVGVLANLGISFFNSEWLKLPSLPEQCEIATVLFGMDSEINALEARREKTRALKQGMMQELLTGRTRLVQPEDRHA